MAGAVVGLVIKGDRIEKQLRGKLESIGFGFFVPTFFIRSPLKFDLAGTFTRTGILQGLSRNMTGWFGTDLLLVAMVMLAGVSVTSSLLANIPVVAAMLLLVKGYLVAAELVPELALGPAFTDWPASTLPVFVAMMFSGTLGGNATLIGASANVVGAGICASHGKPVTFVTFARYGVPLTICQDRKSVV